ncbi:hypothetical protein MMC13_001810 [Lambiella insularis]|nr:hypothetical protein [Lambiella insularis]
MSSPTQAGPLGMKSGVQSSSTSGDPPKMLRAIKSKHAINLLEKLRHEPTTALRDELLVVNQAAKERNAKNGHPTNEGLIPAREIFPFFEDAHEILRDYALTENRQKSKHAELLQHLHKETAQICERFHCDPKNFAWPFDPHHSDGIGGCSIYNTDIDPMKCKVAKDASTEEPEEIHWTWEDITQEIDRILGIEKDNMKMADYRAVMELENNAPYDPKLYQELVMKIHPDKSTTALGQQRLATAADSQARGQIEKEIEEWRKKATQATAVLNSAKDYFSKHPSGSHDDTDNKSSKNTDRSQSSGSKGTSGSRNPNSDDNLSSGAQSTSDQQSSTAKSGTRSSSNQQSSPSDIKAQNTSDHPTTPSMHNNTSNATLTLDDLTLVFKEGFTIDNEPILAFQKVSKLGYRFVVKDTSRENVFYLRSGSRCGGKLIVDLNVGKIPQVGSEDEIVRNTKAIPRTVIAAARGDGSFQKRNDTTVLGVKYTDDKVRWHTYSFLCSLIGKEMVDRYMAKVEAVFHIESHGLDQTQAISARLKELPAPETDPQLLYETAAILNNRLSNRDKAKRDMIEKDRYLIAWQTNASNAMTTSRKSAASPWDDEVMNRLIEKLKLVLRSELAQEQPQRQQSSQDTTRPSQSKEPESGLSQQPIQNQTQFDVPQPIANKDNRNQYSKSSQYQAPIVTDENDTRMDDAWVEEDDDDML